MIWTDSIYRSSLMGYTAVLTGHFIVMTSLNTCVVNFKISGKTARKNKHN